MLFNSLDFAVFLPIVFLLYWFVFKDNLKQQNLLILVSSYFFYGWWDWRFLSLILFSTLVDYLVGLRLGNEEIAFKRKLLLWVSIFINLGFLGFFKYYDFFLENFISAFSFMGVEISASSLNIILPVGISFYTFQTLSYTIDVYRRKLQPCYDFIAFGSFVSFFPQLVAGPIERATDLLPQFFHNRKFSYSKGVDGLRQILWGFFKKIVIADNCAEFSNLIFNNSDNYNGSTLILGALFFTFQIYCDFSGYSDIAIGTSKIFGFELKKNFAFPYFSRDIAEFWRRWHISLSKWFRDYLYIPLGGSKGGKLLQLRNTFIIFLVSGFWHGANWTFLAWGALNAFYFVPLLLLGKNRQHLGHVSEKGHFPGLIEAIGIFITFGLTVFAWIFFRADNMGHAIGYLSEIFSKSTFELPDFRGRSMALITLSLILCFVSVEWLGRKREHVLQILEGVNSASLRYVFYLGIVLTIMFMGNFKGNEFIYFQF